MDINTDKNNPFQGLSIQDLNARLFAAIRTSPEEKDHAEIDALLEAGADINVFIAGNGTNINLLMCATMKNDPITFYKLINLGADIHKKNNKNATTLMTAALGNNPGMVDFLIKRGVDVNATDDKGNTALMVAISFKATETTNYLLGIMSNEEIQSLKDKFYSLTIGLVKHHFDMPKAKQDYQKIIEPIENFQTELNNNRKKLCTLLFSNKDGLPHHDIIQYPLMPTLNTHLLPEMMEMIFDLKFLSLANQFPEWYKLSCLKQDIKFFLNWKPVPQQKDNEVTDDTLPTVKNSFLSFFESIRNYIAPSEAPKRRREDNDDAGPENHKKPKL